MLIRFWGVRGSIASPGPATAEVGGNTSCVEVTCGGQRFILDAGTGLRRLGDALLAKADGKGIDATLLLSHYHWDHIQGLPFFVPAYLPSTKLTIVGGKNARSGIRDTLAHQMTEPVFPVRLDELRANLEMREIAPAEVLRVGDVTVRAAKGNHPGGVMAYRIDHAGKSVVFATDTEHFSCVDPQLRALAEGADVLIYDSQYTEEEYGSKVGWGHSTYVAGAALANAAGVSRYVLFHHDPKRGDAEVKTLETRARELFPGAVAAREDMEISLSQEPAGAAA
jgi:phosphoribosyl 1,2-cyclic phosphodiesterase